MREAEAEAQSVIEQARVQGGRRVSGHVERIRAGQAGRRIVEEAIDMRAAAIVLPLPRRIQGASLFGKTLETVLAERPVPGRDRVDAGLRRRIAAPGRAAAGARVRALTLLISGLMVFLGVAILLRTIAAGGGPGRSGSSSACCSSAPAPGGCGRPARCERHRDEEDER